MTVQHLPVTRGDMLQRGWDRPDIVLVTGDANVDVPSFPANLLGRVLESQGYRVCLLSRPDPKDPESVKEFGLPRLCFGITAGAMDSMVSNYTATGRLRSDDPFAPGGRGGGRPDRALTVYGNLIRRAWGKRTFIIAGGIEASLRRFAHYDYWSDSVRRPVLMDCGADVLVYGSGEVPLLDIMQRLDAAFYSDAGFAEARDQGRAFPGPVLVELLKDVPGMVYRQAASAGVPAEGIELPDAEAVAADSLAHVEAWRLQEGNRNARMWQKAGGMRVIANPPPAPMTPDELDAVYDLDFTRDPHPMYGNEDIPAHRMVWNSVTSHRGCFGGCAFCAIGAHQGKTIVSRSPESILREVASIAAHPQFGGTISDIGGPTANMYGLACGAEEPCNRPSCLWPKRCPQLKASQTPYLSLLRRAQTVPGVRHVHVSSGIRTDLAMDSEALVRALAFNHTSGNMKVAPEHTRAGVLKLMRKPDDEHYPRFVSLHRRLSGQAGRQQFVVPYLMAAHPGTTMADMVEMAKYLVSQNIKAEQCQIFTPTPGTASTVMYATGINPADGTPVFVERDNKRKNMQKALILWHLPENRAVIEDILEELDLPRGYLGMGRRTIEDAPPPPRREAPRGRNRDNREGSPRRERAARGERFSRDRGPKTTGAVKENRPARGKDNITADKPPGPRPARGPGGDRNRRKK